ncbi:hypothetical protein B0I35DRAFT_128328 [Stachybotrys elegans]|uniref:Uncharacterized protein n=1 Tax=Stachybotrys elegans TaxID=80388 RepID=A0A8K0SY72_9HYPO|nr:hypothetical protein B0I35DRAFT_128328 [Stachybotrys elegans]
MYIVPLARILTERAAPCHSRPIHLLTHVLPTQKVRGFEGETRVSVCVRSSITRSGDRSVNSCTHSLAQPLLATRSSLRLREPTTAPESPPDLPMDLHHHTFTLSASSAAHQGHSTAYSFFIPPESFTFELPMSSLHLINSPFLLLPRLSLSPQIRTLPSLIPIIPQPAPPHHPPPPPPFIYHSHQNQHTRVIIPPCNHHYILPPPPLPQLARRLPISHDACRGQVMDISPPLLSPP